MRIIAISIGIASLAVFLANAEPYSSWWRSEPLNGSECGPFGDFIVQARGLHSDIVVIEQVVGHEPSAGHISVETIHTPDYVLKPFVCRDVHVRFNPNDVVIISHNGYGTDFYGFRSNGVVSIGHENIVGEINIDPAGRISMKNAWGELWAYCWTGANWTKGRYEHIPACDPYHWVSTIERRDKPNSNIVVKERDGIRSQPAS